MIVSNRNLKDAILFEESLNQTTDDSCVNIKQTKTVISRKLSTPLLNNLVSSRYGISATTVNSTENRKMFKRAASVPNFSKDDDGQLCQSVICKALPITQRRQAFQVCHHSDCHENNGSNPVLLCLSCDKQIHTGTMMSHLRFDLPTTFQRKLSVRSNNSDSGTEEDSDLTYRFDKKNRSYGSARRFFNMSATKTRVKLKRNRTMDVDSSKEFFTLQFYDDAETTLDSEKVPVRKGKSLKESIELLLTNRELNFNTHSIFLESSNTPLPLAFDTFPLGGNTLHVKANRAMHVDERIITLMKDEDKKNQGQRQKKVLSDLDQAATGKLSNVSTGNSKLSRKSGLFSSVKDVTRSLTDILTHYSNYGFESDSESVDEEPILLEDSWTNVIIESEHMTRKEKIQQEAIWELLQTERNYLRKLRVIIQVFEKCLRNLQREGFLTEVDKKTLFSNINEVYGANNTLWNKNLKQILDETRSSKAPIKPSQLLDSFSKFEVLFEPYIQYCLQETTCVKYLKHLKRTNEMFEEYLVWCENHRQCMRLKLADLLVKPMQRVTKYALLLKTILSKTSDGEERLSIKVMVSKVERFVTKINTTLRIRHEQQKLENVLNRFEIYNPMEAVSDEVEKVITDYCKFNLCGKIPGLPEDEPRCIVLEGPMKVIEKQGRSDVQAFLFTDIFVLAKTKKGSEKFRITRQPFRLNKLVIHQLKDAGSFVLIYLNEYGILVTAFTLQVNVGEYTKWIHAIESTKKHYENARSGHGSTLDFFDDDMPPLLNTPHNFTPNISPCPDRRSTMIAEDGRSTPNIHPPIVVFDDIYLHKKENSTRSKTLQKQDSLMVADSYVKRSLSDPKPTAKSNPHKSKPRPMSLIVTSDHDIASWVLTNEKLKRSGSIPSDLSNDSRRSSGIGDSFRSINSDGIVHQHNKDGIVISTFDGLTEVSNVAKLKARFENCQSPSTDGSNSSIPTACLTGFSESITTSCSNGRRSTQHDFMEQPGTIHEEDEQLLGNSFANLTKLIKQNENAGDDSDESFKDEEENTTVNDDSSTIKSSSHETSYENIDFIRKISTIVINGDKEDINFRSIQGSSEIKTFSDIAVQYEDSDTNSLKVIDDALSEDINIIENLLDSSKQDLPPRILSVDVSTQCGVNDSTEVAVQCKTLLHDVCTQCGDLIQLKGVCDSDVMKSLNYSTPMLDILLTTSSNQNSPKQLHSILKHSSSEAKIELVNEYRIIHTRSHSDEPKRVYSSLPSSPEQKHRNSTLTYGDFPGMRALQTLSESLESSLQHVTKSVGVKVDAVGINNNNRNGSSSLRKLAMVNCSPVSQKKDLARTNSSPEQQSKTCRKNSSPGQKNNILNNSTKRQSKTVDKAEISPEQRGKTSITTKSFPEHKSVDNLQLNNMPNGCGKSVGRTHSDNIDNGAVLRENPKLRKGSHRYTWHDFDSVAALERVERTKYGPDGRSDELDKTLTKGSKLGKNRTLSKSSQQIYPKKQKSLKRSIFKKFSDSKLDDSVSSVYSKADKKQLEKEKKRLKKEKKIQEKEEKKREKANKRRSSMSSNASSMHSSITADN